VETTSKSPNTTDSSDLAETSDSFSLLPQCEWIAHPLALLLRSDGKYDQTAGIVPGRLLSRQRRAWDGEIVQAERAAFLQTIRPRLFIQMQVMH
jgi:hypothetical protein